MRDKTTEAMAAASTNVMVGMLRSLSGGRDSIDVNTRLNLHSRKICLRRMEGKLGALECGHDDKFITNHEIINFLIKLVVL